MVKYQRQFADIIYDASSKWPNWDPPETISAGDYGTVNKTSGRFEREGNVFNIDRYKQWSPHEGPIEDVMIIANHSARNVGADPAAQADGQVAEAVIKLDYQFTKNVGALVFMYKCRQYSLPEEMPFDILGDEPLLTNKAVVRSVYRCPAYALYLSRKGGHKLSIALDIKAPIPQAPIVSAGVRGSASWRDISVTGVFRCGGYTEPQSDTLYSVLYTLKESKYRPFKRFRGIPDNKVGWDRLHDYDLPWGVLDSDGEEEEKPDEDEDEAERTDSDYGSDAN